MPNDILQIPPTSILENGRTSVELMVDEVAGLLGQASDPTARTRALVALDRAADRLNMHGLFMFRRKEKLYTADDDGLVADQETLELPSDWQCPAEPSLVYNSEGKAINRLQWVPWDTMRTSFTTNTGEGATPMYLSIKNEWDRTVYLSPRIDITKVASIRLAYFGRVERPSETDEIALVPEVREALIVGAQALSAQRRYIKAPAVWRPMLDDFERCVQGAIASSNRQLNTTSLAARPDIVGDDVRF